MRKNIRIENPVSGCAFTSKNRAKRFVAQGRAEWVQAGVSIRFVQSDHRHNSAQKSVNQTRWSYDRAAHTGLAQIADLATLPMIQPSLFMGVGRRKGATHSRISMVNS
jgi:hypothetical protein